MRLGFYGHSTVSYSRMPVNKFQPIQFNEDDSLIDIVCKHYKAILVNKGVIQGSIERILLDLKKTKKIDFAFIFYPASTHFYLPRTNRDISIKDFDRFFTDNKAQYLWHIQKESYKSIEEEFYKNTIKDVFDSVDDLIATLSLYKKYLHDPEVHLNRWYGSLIQIDQYLCAKSIPCLHVIDKNIMPSWFNFKSGNVAYHIHDLCMENYELGANGNSISTPGQKIIADALIAEVEKFTNNFPLTTDK